MAGLLEAHVRPGLAKSEGAKVCVSTTTPLTFTC